ncbi:MAG: hypothetical protein J5809_01815 [Selenomonadaceae bacterium]|nr:hypothetical protein [Selenomonadaceae bacterium]
MNFISKKLKKVLVAAVAGGTLLFGGGDALAFPNTNAGWDFRNTYLSIPYNNNIFHQSIVFFGTSFHVDIDSYGQILRDASMRQSGNINWEYTNPATNVTSNSNMPFYVEQNGEEMMLYVQRNGRWSKFAMPGIPVGIANALKSADLNTLTDNMNAIKDVEIFRDTDTVKIYNITLDGQYLAQKRYRTLSGLSSDEVATQERFYKHLNAALNQTDFTCTWTVNKKNNTTASVVVDLTPVMRAYAQDVLDDSAAGIIKISDEERMLMETIGYYSEFHYSYTYTGNGETHNLTPPSAARRATTNGNIFEDFFKDMANSER